MTQVTAPIIITKEQILSFGNLYDPLPLHTDEAYAKSTRFGDLIAPGVMSFMLVWAEYLKICPFVAEFLAGKSTSMEWHKPVYADDILYGKAVITKLTRRSSRNGIVEITIEVYNQNNVHVLSNVTEAIVKCEKTE